MLFTCNLVAYSESAKMSKALGLFRAVYLVALCCVGSFLFAYDTGIVGGILTFPSFQRDFRYSNKERATVGSNSTSLLQGGGKLPPCQRTWHSMLILNSSLLLVLLCLAVHRKIWPTLVPHPCILYFQHRRCCADDQHTLSRRVLCRSSDIWCRCWNGHCDSTNVLC